MRKAWMWPATVLPWMVASSAGTLAEGSGPTIVTPYTEAKWISLDPARPDLVQIAVLRGDPNTGPSSMLMKMQKYPGPRHDHSSTTSSSSSRAA